MIQLSPENIESVGRGYLLKVCYKKVPVLAAATAGLIIESNMTPPEMGLSPLVGLLKNLMAVSLAHSLKHALKISMSGSATKSRKT